MGCLVAKNPGHLSIKINCLIKNRCHSCSSARPPLTLEVPLHSHLFMACSLCAQNLFQGFCSERGMSRAFLLLSTFHFPYPSPNASSAAPNLAVALTPHIVKCSFNPFSSVRKCPPALPGAAHYNFSRQKSSTSRLLELKNMAGPIPATSYTHWQALIAKA